MPGPAVTKVMQIGIVVPDLEAAIRAWEERLGVGPWTVFTLDPADCRDVRVNGRPAEWSARAATTMVGEVMLELIEPVRDDDLFGTFLAEHGPGVHHVAMRTPDYDGVLAGHAARGEELVLTGRFTGIDVSYLPTQQDLGVLLEVFKGF
ncbi:MAG TPA: VOC family protein [Miltoncostaeaceae bacterium]|nr:VOC family protein [Miltoncostaeaceae bacterium]